MKNNSQIYSKLSSEIQKVFQNVQMLQNIINNFSISRKSKEVPRKEQIIKKFKNAVMKVKLINRVTQRWNQRMILSDPKLKNSYLSEYTRLQLPKQNVKQMVSQVGIQEMSKELKKDYKKQKLYITQQNLDEQFPQQFINFDFDILKYDSNKDQIIFAWKILNFSASKLKQSHSFQLQKANFLKFIQNIHYHYNKRNNWFHNFKHGISVMHYVFMITEINTLKKIYDQLQGFSFIFSGLCHDVNHTGRTNLFEINSQSKLALRYNDQSVLQNYHLSTTFKELKKTKLMQSLSYQNFIKFRQWVILCILATDIKKHFSLLQQIQQDLTYKDINIQNIQRQDQNKKKKIKQNIACLIIHCSDFNGNTKQIDIIDQWSIRVNKQFSTQYQLQKKLGIKQTPYFKDLQIDHIRWNQQFNFVTAIVKPSWLQLNLILNNQIDQPINNMNKYIQILKRRVQIKEKQQNQ